MSEEIKKLDKALDEFWLKMNIEDLDFDVMYFKMKNYISEIKEKDMRK